MRARAKRRQRQGGGDHRDRWMITYADLITLLLIFFVVMYAMSSLDAKKYEVVVQSLQDTFHKGDSILEQGSGITGTADVHTSKNPPTTKQPSSDNKAAGSTKLTEREQAFRKQEEELQNLMGVIEQYISDNKLQDQIFVADQPRGIVITLNDRFLFDQGRAALKQGSANTLSKLASLFRDLKTPISIEGHTDNIPFTRSSNSSTYKDNWELSGARALSVLRFFLDREGLSPTEFQYAGYADTRPVGDNTTEAGRQKNRRVEITVLRQLQQ
ncbi:ompa/motb domain protein [Paenibacillus terrae HPL-003]|jgi:chemotaxis protein MotB|uniref:Ompa/motb domain protein n=1 Tax=Paenibacillus terrae (strain HPL-003) TaxID=985665 RepID=G7VUL6_PAETH|nr:flagellar motor protein MotB [Paenibacillus terrae]AET57623.1 ompa/motb domain protein [Paenibacillus terrae HPL-003]